MDARKAADYYNIIIPASESPQGNTSYPSSWEIPPRLGWLLNLERGRGCIACSLEVHFKAGGRRPENPSKPFSEHLVAPSPAGGRCCSSPPPRFLFDLPSLDTVEGVGRKKRTPRQWAPLGFCCGRSPWLRLARARAPCSRRLL